MAFTKVISDADLTVGMTLVVDTGCQDNRWKRALVLKIHKSAYEKVNIATKVEVGCNLQWQLYAGIFSLATFIANFLLVTSHGQFFEGLLFMRNLF